MTARYDIPHAPASVSLKLCIAISLVATAAFHSPNLTNSASNFVFRKNILTWRNHSESSPRTGDGTPRGFERRTAATSHIPTFLSSSSSWLKETLTGLGLDFDTEQQAFEDRLHDDGAPKPPKSRTTGVVLRTATKSFHPTASNPSSPLYTTRKTSRGAIALTPVGATGDYNHYRTVALGRTGDRAVSILTTDVLESLRETAGYGAVQVGDLGENIYVDGVGYAFFEVGGRYRFAAQGTDGGEGGLEVGGVIVEITERIEPCGNLCKLPYINDMRMQPDERLERCKDFLFWLSRRSGLRGWYGRIIQGGAVKVGDKVLALDSISAA